MVIVGGNLMDKCINCEQETFINRIPTELFDENGNVIDDDVYRCEDCEEEVNAQNERNI